ncbi:MAG TPA: SRPBCC family protein [Caulobacteraceae bacterium]
MTHSRFLYVTYIRTTPQALWDALTQPEFTRAYWHGVSHVSTWEKGAPWKMVFPDGRVTDTGAVLEADPPRRLVLEWRNEFMPELKAEGFSRCTFEITADGDVARLAITHEIDVQPSKLIEAVSTGWPMILSSLKTLLETGKPLVAAPAA